MRPVFHRVPHSGVLLKLQRLQHNTRTARPSLTSAPILHSQSQIAMTHTNTQNGSSSYQKVLRLDTINPAVVSAKYAVRGELALRANELTEQLNNDPDSKLPFKDVVHCEIGNPQALDQKPLTFFRQVCAHVEMG